MQYLNAHMYTTPTLIQNHLKFCHAPDVSWAQMPSVKKFPGKSIPMPCVENFTQSSGTSGLGTTALLPDII